MSRKRPKKINVERDARRLFEETKDFRYVAMAIGQSPNDPPDWAKWACRKAYWLNEQTAPSGHPAEEVGALLDEIIKFYIDWETSAERTGEKRPSLAAAIGHLLSEYGLVKGDHNTKSYKRKLRAAWDAELKAGRPCKEAGVQLLNFPRVTNRMKRHLGGANTNGMPISTAPVALSQALLESTKKQQ